MALIFSRAFGSYQTTPVEMSKLQAIFDAGFLILGDLFFF